MILGTIVVWIIFCVLAGMKPKLKILGIKIYNLRYPLLVLGFILFVWGVPMVVTGSYYGYWSKRYDVTGDCDALQTITAKMPLPKAALFTPENMTIAYLGDSGVKQSSLDVLGLVKSEDAEAIVHVGDFDYCDDSTLFGAQIDDVLGEDFPFIPVVGNHDLHVWGDYADVLSSRKAWSNRPEHLQCSGTLFVNYWCMYRGLFLAFSSVGTMCGDGYKEYGWHEDEMAAMLGKSGDYADTGLAEPWVTCVWHKNQQLMQTGDKSDETGYGMYDLCANEGALIVTGHDHAYGRTHALSDVENQKVGDACASKLDGICIYDLYEGQAIVGVVGLGGREVGSALNTEITSLKYWAKTFSSEAGALFCKYNYKGAANLAYCYFKTIKGTIIDQFYFLQRTPIAL